MIFERAAEHRAGSNGGFACKIVVIFDLVLIDFRAVLQFVVSRLV